MNIKHSRTLQQVEDFVHGSAARLPLAAIQAERYAWIGETLARFDYPRLARPDKGLIMAYLMRLSGYSRQQLTRLIHRWRETGTPRWDVRPAAGFKGRYTAADVRLLAELDALHETPSGPALSASIRCIRATGTG